MVAHVLKPVRALARSAAPKLFWPVIVLLLLCFGCVFLLLYVFTGSQDAMQLERERQALSRSIATATQMVQHDLQDYAKWDDAVRHTENSIQSDWVEDNIVAYLGRTQGYSYVFILNEHDATAYKFGQAARSRSSAQQLIGPEFTTSIASVRSLLSSPAPIVSGFSRQGSDVFVYSTAAIVPLTQKIKARPGPPKLLVIARRVDPTFVQTIGKELRLSHLALTDKPGTDAAVPLVGSDKPVAWLEWSPHRPGSILLRQLTPALVVLAIVALLTAGLIIRRGSNTFDALKTSELRARHHAFHDLLTGLPNRRALVDEITTRLAGEASLTLLYLDLDGFKDANDVYGHAAGDLLLKEAAIRIQDAVGGAFVARAGGDEFAALLSKTSSMTTSAICDAILRSFRLPFEISAYRITLGVSIGCARATEGDGRESGDELMRRADVAMYSAKSEGKNRASYYIGSLDDGHALRMRLERDLQDAVEEGKVFACYQPIVDAETRATVAYEALARWYHPEHGHVSPDVFIPIAEMTGLISEIGRCVLAEACFTMKNADLELAVNLSPAQFWDRNLVADVETVLAATQFPANRLELEITESLLIRRPEKAAEIIGDLRELGIKIVLDDFGTGFASIGYLQRLRLDRIKVDKSFVAPLEATSQAREMLLAIVTLSRAFGLEVCAEGVEKTAQADIARAAGCTRLQGWLFGRPVSAKEVHTQVEMARILEKQRSVSVTR